MRFLISLGINLLANAIGLAAAAAILDKVEINGVSFVMAVLIFTGVEVLTLPLLQSMALQRARALQGSVALVATLVGLIVTDIVSDGLTINGSGTWILATIIVWFFGMIAAIILPIFLVKEGVQRARS